MSQTEQLLPTPEGILRAAAILRAGGLVAFPTETVYGLGGDARDDRAVAGIYAAKGRPRFNPLIVHVADLAMARKFAQFDARAEAMAARFWPGPLTLVLPLRADAGLSELVTAELPTVAIRLPAHPVAQALLSAFDGPLAAPSPPRSARGRPGQKAHDPPATRRDRPASERTACRARPAIPGPFPASRPCARPARAGGRPGPGPIRQKSPFLPTASHRSLLAPSCVARVTAARKARPADPFARKIHVKVA